MSGSATVRRSSLTSPASESGLARPALDLLDRDAQLGQEPRRLLAVVLRGRDRRDDEAGARAGAGDVEEAALLLEQLAGGHGRDQLSPADPVGLEHRGASAQVGPAVLLDVGDHDEIPLQALGPVCGEQPDRRAADPLLGEGVGRDLLGHQAREEVADSGGTGDRGGVALLGLTRGDVEQRDHGVEVAMCSPGCSTAVVDGTA